MRKILLLFVFAMGIISFANAQVIDLIGKGIIGNTTSNLTPTDVSNIDFVDTYAIYSKRSIDAIPTAVSFISLLETPTTNFFDYTNIINQSIVPDPINGAFYTARFNNVDNTGVNINVLEAYKNDLHSFYAYVHRTAPNATYKSFLSEETMVYFYHNGVGNQYVFNIPIETAAPSSSRNVKIKIPISELDITNRNLVIDITAGPVEKSFEENSYSLLLGESFLLGEYELENVPGNVANIAVSVYSPVWITNENQGDSFYISTIVADVDKVEEECGECEGKVTSLEMQYNGSTDATIKVTDKKGDELIFEGPVVAGGTFNLTGFDKKGTLGTEILLYVDGVQNTKIHTSCSQPIGPGLMSGAFKVLGGVSREGGILCPVDTPPNGDCGECEGKVTWLEMQYNGSTDATILVLGKKEGNIIFEEDVNAGGTFDLEGFDKKNTLGTEIILYVNGVQNTKIHTSCSKPIGPGLISGDFEVIGGVSREGGILCPVDVPPTPPNGGDCGECDGKATTLEMQYNGSSNATIKVTDKKGDEVIFEGSVAADDTFNLTGFDKHGTLGTEIIVYVNDALNTKIHTSCSQPLYIGLVSGDFTIVDGYSRNGGQLCETSNKTLNTASFDSCDDCGNVLTYPNPASDFVTIRFKPENSVNTKVILYNLYGQSIDVLYNNVVERDREREIKYNVEKLTNGLYFVKIINGSSTLTKKIIVRK